jgi:ABC-type Fe3+-citrate transport system substrate-binding protein
MPMLMHKIKPTLDLLGLNVAFEEILQVEAWTKVEGKKKDIDHTFQEHKTQVKDAIKEIKRILTCSSFNKYS